MKINELDISSQVFKSYAFYSSLLIFKMILLSFLTVGQRLRRKVVQNQEDLIFSPSLRISVDEEVERFRRAHLDDLENILPFFTLGIIYCFTHPSPATANFLFQTFTVARVIHSFAYVIYIVRQPVRAFSWSVATVVNLYMGFKIFFYFM